MSTKAPIVVIGAGPVGLLTAVGLAEAREVRLVDREPALTASISRGEAPIWEPELDKRLASALERGRLKLHTNVYEALSDGQPRLVFVAVGTPGDGEEDEAGERADMRAVEGVLQELLPYRRLAIVMKSTVPPGTGEAFLERARLAGSDVRYLSCPEFLQEGEAFARIDRPDRIVVGRDEPSWASRELRALHEELYPTLLRTRPRSYAEMDLVSAELVKHSSNLHLAIRICFANQTAALCEELGADVEAVMRGVGADRRIGEEFLEAGLGFGGSCFSKDVQALRKVASDRDVETPLADAVVSINKAQPIRAVNKLKRGLGGLKGRRVALLGIAFKAGTADVRASPVFALAAELRGEGASVMAWDPRADARRAALTPGQDRPEEERLEQRELASSWSSAVAGADAVVLVTGWPEIVSLDWPMVGELMSGDLVLDGRNELDVSTVRKAGLRYVGTGRLCDELTDVLEQAGATDAGVS